MDADELESKFIAALNDWVALTEEYSRRFTSTKPLGYETIPVVNSYEIEQLTLKIQQAEALYLELRKHRYGV